MDGLFCGIDIGTTNLKVALLDAGSRPVWLRRLPMPRAADGLGPVTDAARLLSLLEATIAEGWRAAGAGAPLVAIACAGVGEDGLCLDADLRPLGPAIPWFDERAAGESRRLLAALDIAGRAGLAPDPHRTVAKWLWLAGNRPEETGRAAVWAALADWPAVAWSGRAFMSETLAARTAAYDCRARRFDASMLLAAAAPPLPPVLRAGTVVGTMREGPLRASGAAGPQTLLVAGGHDHPVAASAARRIEPAARVDSIGTANLVYGEAPGAPAPGRRLPALAFSVPFAGGEAGFAALGVFPFAAALDAAAGGAGGLRAALALPRLPGAPSMPPLVLPGALAAAPPAGPRRALEAAAFFARRLWEAMDEAGLPPGPLFATGGWTRSRALCHLRASAFGRPVRVLDEPELTVTGAAMLAADAAGLALAPARRGLASVEPDEGWARLYDGLYAEWRPRCDAALAEAAETPPGWEETKR